MNGFTYEFNDRKEKLEKYEWDNVWWEHATHTGLTRVLYIGDSISCGTRRLATEVANGALYFDGFGTSKALDNPYLPDALLLFARQQGERRAIIFNNGLHGWHLDDTEQYPYYYEKTVKLLLDEFPDVPLAIVLTTSVADEQREARVIKRNEAAVRIAKKYALPIIDLYSLSQSLLEYRKPDGVHFLPEGYTEFAKLIVNEVKKII